MSFCSSLNAKEMRFLFFFLKGKANVFFKFFSLSVVDFFLTCEQKSTAFLDERAAYHREYSRCLSGSGCVFDDEAFVNIKCVRVC